MAQRGNNTAQSRPGAWFWLLPVAYAVHIADEFFVGAGFYTWVGSFVPFSAASFLGVNFMIILLIAVAVGLARRSGAASFLAVAVLTQFILHGLFVHPAFSIWETRPSPGLATGVLVLMPLALLGFRWAATLPRRDVVRGVGAGALLFASQDLWRVLFNSLLSPAA